MASDFFRLHSGRTFDAIKAMNLMTEVWGVTMDWHVFAAELDAMHTRGDAIIAEQNGMTEYIIE